MGNPIWIPACISFNFLKQSSSANGTNVLFLWICHLSLTSLQEWKFYEWPLKFSLTAKGILIPWFNFKTFLAWQPWHTLILRISEIQIKIQIKMFFSNNRNENIEAITGVRHLQTADRRLQTADCRLHEAVRLLIEWNQKYRNKGGVIINITLFREVRPRSEVYIFHANCTDLIPKGAVGCSFRIELEQNNACRCHKLAHDSIATVYQFSLHHRRN